LGSFIKTFINGILALSIADTSGDFPQPSNIIRITFLFIGINFKAKIKYF
jgi:hypothetical protein